ncbi:hypothetical protein [Kitasatospora sp. NPDC093102]|uniref:hypothetical protein n=1 Tax=Kitasatospora sp. NPDC093102 TaxID=3155069 RepID=UPI003444F45F
MAGFEGGSVDAKVLAEAIASGGLLGVVGGGVDLAHRAVMHRSGLPGAGFGGEHTVGVADPLVAPDLPVAPSGEPSGAHLDVWFEGLSDGRREVYAGLVSQVADVPMVDRTWQDRRFVRRAMWAGERSLVEWQTRQGLVPTVGGKGKAVDSGVSVLGPAEQEAFRRGAREVAEVEGRVARGVPGGAPDQSGPAPEEQGHAGPSTQTATANASAGESHHLEIPPFPAVPVRGTASTAGWHDNWVLDPAVHPFGSVVEVHGGLGAQILQVPKIGHLDASSAPPDSVLVPTEHGWRIADPESGAEAWGELLAETDFVTVQLPVNVPSDPAVAGLFANTVSLVREHGELLVNLVVAPPDAPMGLDPYGELTLGAGADWIGGETDHAGRVVLGDRPWFKLSSAGFYVTGGERWEAAWHALDQGQPTEAFAIPVVAWKKDEFLVPERQGDHFVHTQPRGMKALMEKVKAGPDRFAQLLPATRVNDSAVLSDALLDEWASVLGYPVVAPAADSTWDQLAVVDRRMVRVAGTDGISPGRWRLATPPDHPFQGMFVHSDEHGRVTWPPRSVPQPGFERQAWEGATSEIVAGTIGGILSDWAPRESSSSRPPVDLRAALIERFVTRSQDHDPLTLAGAELLEGFGTTPTAVNEARWDAWREMIDEGDRLQERDLARREEALEEHRRSALALSLHLDENELLRLEAEARAEHSETLADDAPTLFDEVLHGLHHIVVETGLAPSWFADAQDYLEPDSESGHALLQLYDLYDRHGIDGLRELRDRLRHILEIAPWHDRWSRAEPFGSARSDRFLVLSSSTGSEDSHAVIVQPIGAVPTGHLFAKHHGGPRSGYELSSDASSPGAMPRTRPVPWSGEPVVFVSGHGYPGAAAIDALPSWAPGESGSAWTTAGHLADVIAADQGFRAMYERFGSRLRVVLYQCSAGRMLTDGFRSVDDSGRAAFRLRELQAASHFAERLHGTHRMPLKVFASPFKVRTDHQGRLVVRVPPELHDRPETHWISVEPGGQVSGGFLPAVGPDALSAPTSVVKLPGHDWRKPLLRGNRWEIVLSGDPNQAVTAGLAGVLPDGVLGGLPRMAGTVRQLAASRFSAFYLSYNYGRRDGLPQDPEFWAALALGRWTDAVERAVPQVLATAYGLSFLVLDEQPETVTLITSQGAAKMSVEDYQRLRVPGEPEPLYLVESRIGPLALRPIAAPQPQTLPVTAIPADAVA